MWRPNRRQILSLAGAAASSTLLRTAHAQGTAVTEIRIGTIFPARTGEGTVRTSVNDYPGEGARMGAQVGENSVARIAGREGVGLTMLYANSPSPEAAQRAAERMTQIDNVHAIVGGIGDGQAEMIAPIAEAAGVPFFNIGSSSQALREACNRFTFHVEASEAMYLDALMTAAAADGVRRWFIVYEDSDWGRRLLDRATAAVSRFGGGAEVAGSDAVFPEQPVYESEARAAVGLEADAILLLINEIDQQYFSGQQQDFGVELPTYGFPTVVSQTRDYIAAARFFAPLVSPVTRVALWDTTLDTGDAGPFNRNFMGRFSEPVDPTVWSSWAAIKIFVESVLATGSVEGAAIVHYLERPDTVFDLMKGPGTSFRPWNHQLRQPLYIVAADPDVVWQREVLETRVNVARLVAQVPDTSAGGDIVALLDTIGNGPDVASCNF